MNFIITFAKLLLIVSGIAICAAALGYPVAHWVGGKLATFLSCLPTEQYDQALPALGIPATKAIRGDLLGAMDGYENLLVDHPQNAEIYSRMLEIALGPMNMPEYGEKILKNGMLHLSSDTERAALLKLHQVIISGDFKPFKHLTYRPEPDHRTELHLSIKEVQISA
ncbi:MAG: hypothetical protein HC845_08325 [Akkermansiaceae bacterium]|nr:hypothetical protein [Akkermansiaceae bacterium]